jgi:hypothetical protein
VRSINRAGKGNISLLGLLSCTKKYGFHLIVDHNSQFQLFDAGITNVSSPLYPPKN